MEVSGLPFVPTLTGTLTGLNLRSAMAATGSLSFPSTANTLNQLQHAIFWGQASNLLGNPSDCPQRDERLGWTGDSALVRVRLGGGSREWPRVRPPWRRRSRPPCPPHCPPGAPSPADV